MTADQTHATIQSPSGRTIKVPTGLFINNKFQPAKSGATLQTVNPATAKVLAEIAAGDKADVDEAVVAARKAFKTTWGQKSTPYQRRDALNKWADLMEQHIDELSELESLDNGKCVWNVKAVDVPDSANCLRYYAGLADKVEGKTIEQVEGSRMAFTRAEAVGVCGQIIPWNYPIQMFAWKVAPALAAGNTIVLKSAESTPLTALRMAELSVEAGFPPGVINVVTGFGQTVGKAISEHHDIDKVAFTGSTLTGRSIMAAAAATNMKKVTLELGGKSPVVVFEDADLEQAANWVSQGVLYNQGQDCAAGTRCFIQKSVHDKFIALLKSNFEAVRVGDPFETTTCQGPQVSEAQYKRVLGYIEAGKQQGATLVTGGGPHQVQGEQFKNGYFIKPTLFTGAKKGMKIVDEEIFGPVLSVLTFDDEADAIAQANDSPYGLGAGIFSQNANRCMRMVNELHSGTVWCNNYMALSNSIPFGGFKQSGFGRELGIEGLYNYTQTKSVNWNYGEECPWPQDGNA
ncbi:unnamed protein product [Sympodiomycopsis kandeliae]